MPETSAGPERLSHDSPELRAPWSNRPASELLCDGSVQNKAVRFGSLEPAHVTLAKQYILPLVVVLALAVCVLACGQSLTLQFCALGLVAFLITAQVFSPLDLGNSPGARRTHKIVSRILLEWSCVVAVLVFLSASFKLTHLFPRYVIASWFLVTPGALLLADSFRKPIARWLASDRGVTQRYIIIGANDVGLDLARRIEHAHAAELSCAFLHNPPTDRVAPGPT